jgi:hypothetical protein
MIETRSAAQTPLEIDPAHLDAAERYVDAIVTRDPLYARLGPDWAALEAARLMQRFLDAYTAVATGDYAKHGRDALRVALAAI